MRIAITLQSLHHLGGIGIYTRQMLEHLLALDRRNEYVLVYPSFGQARRSLGRFASHDNVTEVLSSSAVPHANYWDHLIVPRVARRHKVDVLFNPFLSVPLWGPFRKVLVVHNSEWFTMPEVFWLSERLIGSMKMKAFMKTADRIISVSDAVTEDCVRVTGLPRSKFRTIYHGVSDDFRPITDEAELAAVRLKYRLPDKFILFVGGIYPQKNLSGLVGAFSLMAREVPHQLVVAGHRRWKSEDSVQSIRRRGLEQRVQLLGWVDPADIPALYNLADCFVYPSLYEGFGLCLVEAMACGCPVVGAATGALPEVAHDAALLVDPKSETELKEAMLRVISDPATRQTLVHRGLRRAKEFSWARCAGETLDVIHELA